MLSLTLLTLLNLPYELLTLKSVFAEAMYLPCCENLLWKIGCGTHEHALLCAAWRLE